MTATAHALVGGVIASSTADPALGIALSAASHPLLDIIPHWDFGWGWRQKTKINLFMQTSFDMLFGLILTFLLFGQNTDTFYLLSCIFASVVWDVLEAPYWFLNWKFPPFSSIYNIQSKMQGKAKLPWGILTQVITVGVFFLVFRTFH